MVMELAGQQIDNCTLPPCTVSVTEHPAPDLYLAHTWFTHAITLMQAKRDMGEIVNIFDLFMSKRDNI